MPLRSFFFSFRPHAKIKNLDIASKLLIAARLMFGGGQDHATACKDQSVHILINREPSDGWRIFCNHNGLLLQSQTQMSPSAGLKMLALTHSAITVLHTSHTKNELCSFWALSGRLVE